MKERLPKMLEMSRSGMVAREIAECFGISINLVRKELREAELHDEIRRLREELDAIKKGKNA